MLRSCIDHLDSPAAPGRSPSLPVPLRLPGPLLFSLRTAASESGTFHHKYVIRGFNRVLDCFFFPPLPLAGWSHLARLLS